MKRSSSPWSARFLAGWAGPLRRALTLLFLATVPGTALPPPLLATPAALLRVPEFHAEAPGAPPQWSRVLRAIDAEEAVLSACARHADACPSRSARIWLELLRRIERAPRAEQLQAVNRFVNRWPYRSDISNFGMRDHWATPLEFFDRSGDCEDFAIVKYHSLRRLGFSPAELRLVVVRDVRRDLAHAVLVVDLNGEAVVLDNLNDTVLPATAVPSYVPYYALAEASR